MQFTDGDPNGDLAYVVACDSQAGFQGPVGFVVFKGSTGHKLTSYSWSQNWHFGWTKMQDLKYFDKLAFVYGELEIYSPVVFSSCFDHR